LRSLHKTVPKPKTLETQARRRALPVAARAANIWSRAEIARRERLPASTIRRKTDCNGIQGTDIVHAATTMVKAQILCSCSNDDGENNNRKQQQQLRLWLWRSLHRPQATTRTVVPSIK
jgi:hypothetical protein